MHRSKILALLEEYQQRWPDEDAVANRIRSLVHERADCFDRTCRPGHLTGAAWVVSADRKRHILLHHKKLDRWLQPGGHADGDPDLARVALREASEETGLQGLRIVDSVPLDLDVHLIPARLGPSGELLEDAHEHHDVRFLVLAESSDRVTVSHESHEVRWCSEEQVRALTVEKSVLRMLNKATQLNERRG